MQMSIQTAHFASSHELFDKFFSVCEEEYLSFTFTGWEAHGKEERINLSLLIGKLYHITKSKMLFDK